MSQSHSISQPHNMQQNPKKDVLCEVLRSEGYPEWDELVDRSPHGTIFHHSWWLEAASQHFSILVTRNERGAIVAGIPVPLARKHGLLSVQCPDLTPHLGPVFDLATARGTCDQLHLMRSHGEALAAVVKQFDSFESPVGPEMPDLQGFLWAGFRARLSYVYRFSPTRDVQQILAAMSDRSRHELQEALKLDLEIARDEGVEDLIAMQKKSQRRQRGEAAAFSERVTSLWNAALAGGSARAYVARTNHGVPIAALFAVQDRRTLYSLAANIDPEFRAIPALPAVIWTALNDSIFSGRNFELAGPHSTEEERFFRDWGAASVPVCRIETAGSWHSGLLDSISERRAARRAA